MGRRNDRPVRRPSVYKAWPRSATRTVIVAGGRLFVRDDGELVPLEPPTDRPDLWPKSWWARIR